jgi:hypothetical protein
VPASDDEVEEMICTAMNTLRGSPGRLASCLLAVLIVCAGARPAAAQALQFRNECNAPVVVQAVSVFRGVLRRDRPYLLKPGDVTPGILLPGDKVITVYDAKVPTRVLFQGTVPGGAGDMHFSILPNGPRVRVQLRPPPQP